MSPNEAESVLTLLRTPAELTNKVHDGVLPENDDGSVTAGSYAVLYDADPLTFDDDRLTASQRRTSRRDEVFTVRCVSETPAGVRMVIDSVRTALIGQPPTADGRTCSRIKHDGGDRQPTLDRTVNPHLWFADQDFTFISLPAQPQT